jgi:uncharacterized coiled-coil DUF342 family protein
MDEEKKDLYRKKIEAQIEEWDAQIDVLKAKAKKTGSEARLRLDRQIDDLKSRRETIRTHLKDMQKSGDEAWHKLRDRVDHAVGELKNAWENIKKNF